MSKGSCHCGAVRFQITEQPKWLVDCNCSICRRINALWAHVDHKNVVIERAKDATIAYVQGDKLLAIHTCKSCGCTTHWETLFPEKHPAMAVNFRMCALDEQLKHKIRKFDGAESWTFLDQDN